MTHSHPIRKLNPPLHQLTQSHPSSWHEVGIPFPIQPITCPIKRTVAHPIPTQPFLDQIRKFRLYYTFPDITTHKPQSPGSQQLTTVNETSPNTRVKYPHWSRKGTEAIEWPIYRSPIFHGL